MALPIEENVKKKKIYHGSSDLGKCKIVSWL